MQDLFQEVPYRNIKTISPGIVGVIGDPNDGIRLCVDDQMNPPIRWGRQGVWNSANIQDGTVTHINGKSLYEGPGSVTKINWRGNRSHLNKYGWSRDDMGVGLDTPVMNWQMSLGPTGWNSQVNQTNATMVSGKRWGTPHDAFALGPGQLTRGGLYPRVTQRNEGEGAPITRAGNALYSTQEQFAFRGNAKGQTTNFEQAFQFVQKQGERAKKAQQIYSNFTGGMR